MNLIGHEVVPATWMQAAWTQVWQVTLLIVVVALVVRLLARNRPYLAYGLWLVVLVKCVTPPLFSSTGGVFCWMQMPASRDSAQAVQTSPSIGPTASQGRPLSPKTMNIPIAEQVGEIADGNERPTLSEISLAQSAPLPEAERSSTDVTGVWPPDVGAGGNDTDKSTADPQRSASGLWSDKPWVGKSWVGATLLLSGIWALGTVVLMTVGVVRWIVCLIRIRRGGRRVDPALDRLVASLSRRLRLPFSARLVVTGRPMGPAVIGLFRPTVLLPEIVVGDASAAELEPIIAHELIHARRGDTWLGALQMLAQAVWWFHPLVRWACRLASREAERCCDEAVLAELHCEPIDYARSLLGILQRKRALNPLPAFPGVRPVEVTSRRLERIMRLGQGSRKRSPWWCWAVMLLVAAATLPGAALVVGSDQEAMDENVKELVVEVSEIDDVDDTAAKDQAAEQTAAPDNAATYMSAVEPTSEKSPAAVPPLRKQPETVVSREYHVGDLLARIRSKLRLDVSEAKKYLIHVLPRATSTRQRYSAARSRKWSGTRLVVSATADEHEAIASELETRRIQGFEQLDIEVRFIKCAPDLFDSAGIAWTTLPAEVSAEEEFPKATKVSRIPGDELASTPPMRAQMVVEKRFPAMFAILDDKQTASILDTVRNKTVQAPRLRLFSGQSGVICDASESPFVVGMQDGRPLIRTVSEGTAARLRAVCRKDGPIQLDYGLTFSTIRGVETATLPTPPGKKPRRLQIPEVATFKLDGSVDIPAGSTLLLGKVGTEAGQDEEHTNSLFLLIRPTKLASEDARKRIVEEVFSRFSRTYSVSDLVLPLPHEIVIKAGTVKHSPMPTNAQADFDSLIDLISSTIQPDTWDDVGGWGSIAPYETNLSLVVFQTREVHDEIADLLQQLRRMQSVQVALHAEVIHMPRELAKQMDMSLDSQEGHATLTPRETRLMRTLLKGWPRSGTRPLVKVTLFNGQQADISEPLPPEGQTAIGKLLARTVVSEDRRSVRLDLVVTANESTVADADWTTASVPSGNTLLYDVTKQWPQTGSSDQQTFLLLTPDIVIAEEEEERAL